MNIFKDKNTVYAGRAHFLKRNIWGVLLAEATEVILLTSTVFNLVGLCDLPIAKDNIFGIRY